MSYLRFAVLLLFSIVVFVDISIAQNDTDNLTKTLPAKDKLFWTGYNTCNYSQMDEYVAEDVEFYHDKGGIILGKSNLIESIKKNLCSNSNFRTRREAIAGTIKIYLLKNSNTTYGAIIAGEHYFFNSYDGKPEKREGIAKFTTLWILKDNIWKMSRMLSYDHREAPPINAGK